MQIKRQGMKNIRRAAIDVFHDPDIAVEWNITDPVLSQKDTTSPMLMDSDCNFEYTEE